MDHAAVLTLCDRDTRAGAQPDDPGARIECTGTVTRQVADAHGWNGVLWSGLDDTTANTLIADQIAYFTGLGRGFERKLHGHDLPAGLGSRLTAAGFTREPEETLTVAGTAEPTLERTGFRPLTRTTPYVYGVRNRSLTPRRPAAVSGAPSTGRARRRPVPPGRSG